MAVPSFTHLHGSLGLGLGLGYSPSWLLRVSLRRARGILPRQAQSTCEAESQRTHMGGVHMGGVHGWGTHGWGTHWYEVFETHFRFQVRTFRATPEILIPPLLFGSW